MARSYYSREDIQAILETNALGAPVAYMDREGAPVDFTGDNSVVYVLLSPRTQAYADDEIHMVLYTVQVIHYHKKKLDSIVPLMKANFRVVPAQHGGSSTTQDWIPTYYRWSVYTDPEGW